MVLLTNEITSFTDLILPIIGFMLAVILAGFLYYLARSVSAWAGLKARGYSEREELYLNGTPAVITKLGFLTTTFLILNGGGAVMKWASVSNVSMDAQKIQRVSLRLSILDHSYPKSELPPSSPAQPEQAKGK